MVIFWGGNSRHPETLSKKKEIQHEEEGAEQEKNDSDGTGREPGKAQEKRGAE
jgi:hypothetical protein